MKIGCVNGVTIIDPDHTYISTDATIGQDTVTLPRTLSFKDEHEIGSECVIGPNTEIKDSSIGDQTVIRQSVVHDSEIGNEVTIGPFAHIRPHSYIRDEVRIGNFVEIKKSSFGKGSKASHLSYIGDAEVGADVNFGCGSITVNYDGKNKFKRKLKMGHLLVVILI